MQDYIESVHAFLATQDYLEPIPLAALRAAHRRDELGITSLAVIMIVANYLEGHGGANTEFDPDWIPRLDDMDGIVSVLREIDARGAGAAAIGATS